MMANFNDELLFIAEIRALTKKSTSTIYRWVAKGVFPMHRGKIAERRYWLRSEINAWMEKASAGGL